MSEDIELEVVETYELLGEKRYRIRVKGTIVYVNVAANSEEEAKKKAIEMLKSMELDKVLKELKQ
jgi:hypothetical protein